LHHWLRGMDASVRVYVLGQADSLIIIIIIMIICVYICIYDCMYVHVYISIKALNAERLSTQQKCCMLDYLADLIAFQGF